MHELVSHEAINFFFKRNIPVQQIPNYKTLYLACRMAEMEFLYFNDLNGDIHFRTKDGLRVVTDEYFWIFIEVLCDKRYIFYSEFTQGEYLIFDVGANRGYASLFFALDDKCRNVFSFEPCKHAYEILGRHMGLNPVLSSKIAAFNYGFSDKIEHKIFRTHPAHDWINSGNSQFIDSYLDEKRKAEMVPEEVELRQASEVVAELLTKSPHLQKLQRLLKIDIEGAEYKVLSELKKANVLNSFALIFGECHMGIDGILTIVQDDFELKHLAKEPVNGLFSFVLVNKKAVS